MKRGDRVQVTFCGRTVPAMVLFASENGRSLMLGFDGALAALEAGGGVYAGAMPVLMDEAGTYRDLILDREVRLEALPA